MSWLDKFLTAIFALFKKKPKPPVVEPPVEPLPEPYGDDISLANVVWDEPAGDVGAWPITATLGQAHWNGDGVRVDTITGTALWPVRQDGGEKVTIGNWWLGVPGVDGRIHFATTDWLGRTADGKPKLKFSGKKWNGNDDFHGGVLPYFVPRSGMVVYVLVSGCARFGAETIKERSQIKRVFIP